MSGALAKAVWAIVPARSLREGKTRLASILEPSERERLNRSFLQRTLTAVGDTAGIAGVVVVSPDRAALELARDLGAEALAEAEPGGLNLALAQAERWALERGGDAVLSLFADLPYLTPADVAAILATASEHPVPLVTIAPDRGGEGTNAMLRAPPGSFPFAHGPGSFERHRVAARAVGIEPCVLRRPGLLFDVDSPDDLAEWRGASSAA